MEPTAKIYQENNKTVVLFALEETGIPSGDSIFIRTGAKISIPDDCIGILRSIASTFINSQVYVHPAKMFIFPGEDGSELYVSLKNDGNSPFIVTTDVPIAVIKIVKAAIMPIKRNEVEL